MRLTPKLTKMNPLKLSDIIRESMGAESSAPAPELDPAIAQILTAQMQMLFPSFHRPETEGKESLVEALGNARWRNWQKRLLGALRVTVRPIAGARIVAEQALESFVGTPAEWNFAVAGGLRGEAGSAADPGWIETRNEAGQPHLSVTVSGEGTRRTLVAVIRGVPVEAATPLMLASRLDDPLATPVVLKPLPVGRPGVWQYRLDLQEGDYAVVFGPQ